VNIIYGKPFSGKTSLVDAFLFLKKYSSIATQKIEYISEYWSIDDILYSNHKIFAIMIRTSNDREGYLRIIYNKTTNSFREDYIVSNTLYVIENGVLRIKDIRKARSKPIDYPETIGKTPWDKLSVYKIIIGKLPWRTLSRMVSVETVYWGGFKLAKTHVPVILGKILSSRINDKVSIEDKKVVTEILGELFRYVFDVYEYISLTNIIKSINFKNVCGPSRFRGRAVDPFASNIPWIYLLLEESNREGYVRECLEASGFKDVDISVAKTIDNKYYLNVRINGVHVSPHSLPYSLIKTLTICVVSHYSSGSIVIDDFDEFLNREIVNALIDYLIELNKQFILTTRREPRGDLGISGDKVNIINMVSTS
jgi:hypothetical protein